MLSQEQINAYNRDGYVKVEGLFSPEESAELASEMVRIIGQRKMKCRQMALPRSSNSFMINGLYCFRELLNCCSNCVP